MQETVDSNAHAKAREAERRTDDERFGLIHSLMVFVLRKISVRSVTSASPPMFHRRPAG